MFNARSILENLTGGQGLRDLGEKARSGWDQQSTLGKGAIVGGLLGVLLTSGGRKVLATGAKVGLASLIGAVAYRAYDEWKNGKPPAPETAADVLPPPADSDFVRTDPAEADDFAARLLKAMVAAAKADGHVTAEERARIDRALPQLGLGPEAEAMIREELDRPLDAWAVGALARSEAEAAEIYAATLLVLERQSPEEEAYLKELAHALRLEPGLAAHLQGKVERLG